MKMICKKVELLESVQKIEGAVSIKTPLPVLNNFLMESVDKKLQLIATDLEITIKCLTEDINIIKAGSITIPAKKFIDIIRELPEAEINIEVNDKNLITIICNKTIYKIMGLPKSEFPAILEPKKEITNLKINQGLLKNMIRKTVFSASTDETRKTLTGVFLIIEDKEIKMVGTDGHRLAFIKENIGKEAKNVKVIIPTKILNELTRLLKDDDQDIDISILENQIIFKFNDLVLISRLIEGQYPSYEQIINKIFDKKIKVEKEAFLRAVKRVSLLAMNEATAIKLKAVDNKLVINTVAADIGEAEEEIPAEYKGEEILISFNAKYTMDVLRVIDQNEIEIELLDSTSAGLIKPLNDKNYLYIIMPIRL
ncbi:MAG: DNA polymerase III subunit beta [Candidatus Firestonebacteria bacterium]